MMANSREHLHAWLDYERSQYADVKYADGTLQRNILIRDVTENPAIVGGDDQGWEIFIGNYMKRVQMFGLDKPHGRQAMGKLIVTLLHALETAIDVHGPMPTPGVSSGTITDWEGDTHA
jgi:hypothetical protein